jgi:tripartite-type tricarboxylate transporter receptor subunit TctC
MINDLVGGQIVVAFGDGGASPPQVKAGKIIALAAAGTSRSPALPDISTFDEQGIKFIADSWYGIFGPTRLPAEIVGRLSDEFRKILAQADSLSMLASFGLVAQAAGPAEFKQLVQRDIELWTKVARDANIQSES